MGEKKNRNRIQQHREVKNLDTNTFQKADVERAIKKMSNSNAEGPDHVSNAHVKQLGPVAIAVIAKLANKTLRTGRIPEIWKKGLISPLPKHGKNLSLSSSWRPITLLCPIVKLVERLILPWVNLYVSSNPEQHGYSRQSAIAG